jgi:SAM-dependent methyltransferase
MLMDKYIGNELEIFEHAHNWKNYYGSFIKPLLGKKVAEIGAGIGGTTKALCDGKQEQWLCVEPDPTLVAEIDRKICAGVLPSVCTTHRGYSAEIDQRFDGILYIDVIEHIEDDAAELQHSASLLNDNGYLFIIVPAHQFLYSPFDAVIGHFRRYDKESLGKIIPRSLEIKKLVYLDCIGYFASLVNKYLLKQKLPTKRQVQFWNNIMIPLSRIFDRILGFRFGKSLLLIAKK